MYTHETQTLNATNGNVRHSSKSDKWMTPEWLVEKARSVLGTIDLDPASDAIANELIKADRYIDAEEDALSLDWWVNCPSSIYLNPPGGKRAGKSMTNLFWSKLTDHLDNGLITHAIFLAFSAEALQTTQLNSHRPIMNFPYLIPKRRIQFVDPTDGSKNQPSHSNVIVYIPGKHDHTVKFVEQFRDVGMFGSIGSYYQLISRLEGHHELFTN